GRERQRTLFVLFCIAAGVAAVVSLRTLGLMIEGALTGNMQAANRGDMVIRTPLSIDDADTTVDRTLFELQGSDVVESAQDFVFSASGIARIEAWAAEQGFEVMPAWAERGPFTRIYKAGGESAGFTMSRLVDPARYPFYDTVRVVSPAGATLAQAMTKAHHIAISQDLVEEVGLQVGDEVYLSGSTELFTVTAIVDGRSETTLDDILGAVFSFIYVPYQTGVDDMGKRPNICYVRMPAGTDVMAAEDAFLTQFPGTRTTTTRDLRETNNKIGAMLTRLVTIMGLVSLLIGGIGIANTMAVVVSRRNLEIAVLKTVGAQGRQVMLMFIVEALVLGLLGSALGVALGLGLVLGLQSFGERFISQSLNFSVYPQAVGMGLALGVVVTLAFGILPTLAAGRVRPNVVLRPDDAPVPRAGRLLSLLVALALTALMGFIVGLILGDLVVGLTGALVVVVALGLVTLVLRALLWFLCRLPCFGSISLKLAQRAINAQKGRAASTMLALIIGLLSLSLIVLLTQGTFKLLGNTLEEWVGGNVLVAMRSLEVGKALERKVAELPGVLRYEHDTVYAAEIVAINGDRDVEAWLEEAKRAAGRAVLSMAGTNQLDEFVTRFDMKVLQEETWPYEVVQGEDISAADRERILLEPSVYDDEDIFTWLGLKPGDTLTFRFPEGVERTATVAGITARHESGVLAVSNFRETRSIVPPGFVPEDVSPVPSVYALTIAEERMDETLNALSEVQGAFIVETRQMMVWVERMADQFASLPVGVAALALFASSTIIANAVSLATLERRRQIGIMKALGLQAERVLGLLLLESGLVGLLGGIIGVVLGIFVLVEGKLIDEGIGNLPLGTLGGMVALAVGLTLAATLLTAYGAAREKPLNVLRYE
ncbi:MAG: FtsX-like permease family protein, partial [Anaerolineae bacterium]